MAIQVQHRRGTQAENDAFTGAAGELIYTTDTKRLYMHDGSTQGGILFPSALDSVNDYYGYASAGGTADALTITVIAPLAAYTTGMEITFKATANNTGSATANVNSLGVKTFKKMSAGALADLEADDFVNGGIYTARYDGTYLQVLNIAGGGGGIESGTAVASTSGTSIDFTSIPAGTTQITINFTDVSLSVNSIPLVQIGDSGGVETSGYSSVGVELDASPAVANSSAGFLLGGASNFSNSRHGTIILTLIDASTFTWAATGGFSYSTTALQLTGGSKSLSAELDRVRITSVSGSDTFDLGKINITYI